MPQKKTTSQITEVMVVNDTQGDECRISILQEGHLEEMYSERLSTATNVGNIYKGRVTNVESAIQAAFVDFGQAKSGFLHISDLHPQYFPGQERTEQVGKKIPRRSRPLIQHALKRGDEVLVQVLKEGIGTKGPTLTSYLSIPGRCMVMMPHMDRVGVSRKIEDEDKRREMRKVLDQLDLPEGFGFILRTAGFDMPKTELKRDLSYLMRLWKVMEQRIHKAGAPCELYTESDLLIRTVRDILRPTISHIVVDSTSAFDRVSQFLKVVAPRSAPHVLLFRKPIPIFHAFDIERQIELIHSRSVPLPSGGQIVIDQTEALVAIDVNSGKSRSARDSETNAYQTNCEAADEICRQLRLRDMGGLIINDLIDMRAMKHRRLIEERFRNNLKRDRAKTTALRLSEFGILEMTRQRMRPSLRMSHFIPCSSCDGNGEIKSPEYVAMDATRQLGYLLQQDQIHRVDMVCSPQVASVLLSRRRNELARHEESTRKTIDVRVSETIVTDRVEFSAFNDRNVEIDLEQLPVVQSPSLKELEAMMKEAETNPPETKAKADDKPSRSSRRRRRKTGPANATAMVLAGEPRNEWKRPAPSPETVSKPVPEEPKAEVPETETETPDQASIRIHTLAKQLDTPSRDILSRCREDGRITVTNHMSSVTGEHAEVIRNWFVTEDKEDKEDKEAAPGRRRRRGKRGGRGRRNRASEGERAASSAAPSSNEVVETKSEDAPSETKTDVVRKTKKRRRKSSRKEAAPPAVVEKIAEDQGEPVVRKKKRRPRRKKSSTTTESQSPASVNGESPAAETKSLAGEASAPTATTTKKRRTLYGRRVSVSVAAREEAEKTD